MNEIHVIQPGFYSTVQDRGRKNFAHLGVPQSGVMDVFSSKKANLLLNNSENDAVLEITMSGPQLEFSGDSKIAVCGAVFDLFLNDVPIENGKAYVVEEGMRLRFGRLQRGLRAYLAVSGGIQTPEILGSRSQYEGLTETIKLVKNDILPLGNLEITGMPGARVNFNHGDLFDSKIQCFPGPEFELLPEVFQKLLMEDSFTLDPSSNRMAIQFKEPLPNDLPGITTGPVLPGTVQLTPNGNLIALMADCQVTGGYPRVLQLSEWGQSCLAQKRPGEQIKFQLVANEP